MVTNKYPNSNTLAVTFLEDVKRYNVHSINGLNPSLIDLGDKKVYIYIKNLSPAQLSNDNEDIWRIQLPKRAEFDKIKESDKMFILLGYDYVNKVYTTWNPYWCKQRLNVAESCSMYSRLSLQRRVANTQKIERLPTQNDTDVICIPRMLLGKFLKEIKNYYPEESVYVPTGSSILKRKQEEEHKIVLKQAEEIFDKFIQCYDIESFRLFLLNKGYHKTTVTNYLNCMKLVMENDYLINHKDIFLTFTDLDEYRYAIRGFCRQPDIEPYEIRWHNAIQASLKQYLFFVIEQVYGTKQDIASNNTKQIPTPTHYKLDEFGKLKQLDSSLVEKLVPLVRDEEYPDWTEIISIIKSSYPAQATDKMTPSDWMTLFERTKWNKKRGRKRKDVIDSPYRTTSVNLNRETSEGEILSYNEIEWESDNGYSMVADSLINDEDDSDYHIENKGSKCYIYDRNNNQVYASNGNLIYLNGIYYKVLYTYSNVSFYIVEKKQDYFFSSTDSIIHAFFRSPLYACLEEKDYLNKIESFRFNEKANEYNVSVNGKWFNSVGSYVEEEKTEGSETINDSEVEMIHISKPHINVNEKKPIDTHKLKNIFANTKTSYKYLWFMSIISLAKEKGELKIYYKDILAKMAAIAWPMIFVDNVQLGNNDMISNYLNEIHRTTTLTFNSPSSAVNNYIIQNYTTHRIEQILSPILRNVPYRFLSPWIKYTTDNEVIEKSKEVNSNALYSLHDKYIIVNSEWWEFISSHFMEVGDFALRSFIAYMKQYNSEIKLIRIIANGWSQITNRQKKV